uniref:G-protein coupled receptors family 1 profile domain-containing protein n=1 Tax=Panagrolaimus sp. JU765 TaxID=591449 RepID=A0AC34RRD1_9BILA
MIQFCMGLERACSLVYPIFFREKVEKNSKTIIFATILFVVFSLATGFALAYGERLKPQMYYCGRKAAFSKAYGSFIYATNVVCYVFGFFFNLIAYFKAVHLKKSTSRSSHLKKIRYYLFISFFSTFLVSVPNLISLCSSWIKEVDDAISKPAVWMACINSGLSPFVYFAFNKDYRQRLLNLIEVGREAQLAGAIATTSTPRMNGTTFVQTVQPRVVRF